jgi:hypothetical protein
MAESLSSPATSALGTTVLLVAGAQLDFRSAAGIPHHRPCAGALIYGRTTSTPGQRGEPSADTCAPGVSSGATAGCSTWQIDDVTLMAIDLSKGWGVTLPHRTASSNCVDPLLYPRERMVFFPQMMYSNSAGMVVGEACSSLPPVGPHCLTPLLSASNHHEDVSLVFVATISRWLYLCTSSCYNGLHGIQVATHTCKSSMWRMSTLSRGVKNKDSQFIFNKLRRKRFIFRSCVCAESSYCQGAHAAARERAARKRVG